MNEVWTWWCQEDLFGKYPKKTICLHVQRGCEEFEARYDVDIDFYRNNIVRVVHEPVTEHDFREVAMGIWNEIADKMETWPKVMHFVGLITRYAHRTYGLSGPHSHIPSTTSRTSSERDHAIEPGRKLGPAKIGDD